MRLLSIIDEDFSNYKKAAMFLGVSHCTGKCWKELGLPPETCQNSALYNENARDFSDHYLCLRYKQNPITSAVVFGGLEPLDNIDEVVRFIKIFREEFNLDDDIVIYTGFKKEEDECKEFISKVKHYPNIIVKFGRYIPNDTPRFDKLLGVELISSNQYAELVSSGNSMKG